MKFTIIITLYNRKEKILKALKSALSQEYKELEIIIIDDGSVDNPLSILQDYLNKFKNIRYIYQENKGAAGAKNRGATEATGEYIIFLDSDDWFNSTQLINILSKEIEKYNYDLMSFRKMKVFTNSGIEIKQFILEENKMRDDIFLSPLNYAGYHPYCFKRESFLSVGGLTEDHKWGDAVLFWRKFFLKYDNNLLIDEIVYSYDVRDEFSVSRNKNKNYYDKVYHTISDSYFSLKNILINKKTNKEWEIILFLMTLKMKKFKDSFKFFTYIFSNNQLEIIPSIIRILKNRVSKR